MLCFGPQARPLSETAAGEGRSRSRLIRIAVRAQAGRIDFGRLFGGHAEGDTAHAFARLPVAQDTTLADGYGGTGRADRSTGTFKSVIGIHCTACAFGSVVLRVKLSSGPDAP